MGRFIRYVVLTVAVASSAASFALPSNCVVGSNIYFVSQSGSDANTQAQAKSKSTPWQHAPFMHSFTGTYSHTAGDCFVFRGGDTWVAADYFNITTGGTTGSPDYYGVDPTWYTGASWTRPIFDIQGTLPNTSGAISNIVMVSASWVTFDNWEFVHAACGASPATNQYLFQQGYHVDGLTISNSYFHAFQTPIGGCTAGKSSDGNNFGIWIYTQINSAGITCAGSFDHNIVDGSDGTAGKGNMVVVYDPGNCAPISYNVVHDVCSAFGGPFRLAHDNLIYNFVNATGAFDCNYGGVAGSLHEHAIRVNDGTDADIYNNVIYNTAAEAIMTNAAASGSTTHIYNNVLWGNGSIAIQNGDSGLDTSGNLEIYNNTVAGDGGAIRVQHSLNSLTISNEHHINSGASPSIVLGGSYGTYNYNAANNLYQTPAQAATYYANSGPYMYAPTSASAQGVGLGVNYSSKGLAPLDSDTRYAVSQSAGTLTVPARTPNPRPSSGSWDAGAYLLDSAGSLPIPPTGLAAIVQ